MLDHIDFAVRDVARSRAFYEALLAPLGVGILIEYRTEGREGVGFGGGTVPHFFIGGGAPVSGRLHVAFAARTRSAVHAFHSAGLAAGGTDHGAPGLRSQYDPGYYAAYVVDPDGHVVEAVCRTGG